MDKLIFDRTFTDLLNLTSKAYYNFNDLNRIESWCEYLAEILNSYFYPVSILVKTDWTEYDFPKVFEIERIRTNISTLKQAYFSFTKVPENLEYMTWQKANAIEKILYEIDCILKNMENNFVYCGVAGCGQNRMWQQRFRRKYSYSISKTWEELDYKYWREIEINSTWEEVSA